LNKSQEEDLSETKLAMRLGYHLFSKLACSSLYKLDEKKDTDSYNKEKTTLCQCGCQEILTGYFADTSIGKT